MVSTLGNCSTRVLDINLPIDNGTAESVARDSADETAYISLILGDT